MKPGEECRRHGIWILTRGGLREGGVKGREMGVGCWVLCFTSTLRLAFTLVFTLREKTRRSCAALRELGVRG